MLFPGQLSHPMHLSVTNITYENGLLSMEMKSFRDDWETAYFHFHSKPIDFTQPEMREIPWFREYLEKCFRVSVDGGKNFLELNVGASRLEEDALWITMGCNIPGKPKTLYLYNTLLTDIFPDQTNLVIFGFEKKETGIKFDVRNQVAEVALN